MRATVQNKNRTKRAKRPILPPVFSGAIMRLSKVVGVAVILAACGDDGRVPVGPAPAPGGQASRSAGGAVDPSPDSTLRITYCAADPQSGRAPVTVSFLARADSGEGQRAWLWDFGDGSSSTDRIAEHRYFSGGRSEERRVGKECRL